MCFISGMTTKSIDYLKCSAGIMICDICAKPVAFGHSDRVFVDIPGGVEIQTMDWNKWRKGEYVWQMQNVKE